MFAEIFKFELRYHARQPLVYVISAVLFLLNFGATVSDNISIGGTLTNININSPFNIIIVLANTSFFTSLFAGVAYASSPALRDFDHNIAEIFLTTRVKKFDYLFGRFCGALIFCFIVYLAAAFGIFLGEFMPWIDPDRLGPLRLDAYWFATWAIALPNILMMAALVFLIATLTRSLLASFLTLFLILVVQSVVGSLVDPEDIRLLSLLDPFGLVALSDTARYWTPFQMNEQIMPVTGNFLYNRLIVLVFMSTFTLAAYHYFTFSLDFATEKTKFKKFFASFKKQKKIIEPISSLTTPISVNHRFGFASQILQFISQLRIEFYSIIIGKAFLMIALFGMLQVAGTAYFGLGGIYGTEVYPTTTYMVSIINSSYTLPLILVLIFYSSELMVRENNMQISEMVDAMPYPNWVAISAKLVGLMLVMAAMLFAAMIAAIVVQALKGYFDFNFLQYFFGLFSFFQFPIWFTCVFAVFAHVVAGNRYIGMFVVLLYFAGSLILPQQGFDHNLYLFATPQIPYSVFTGFGPNLSAYVWFSIYWTIFCGMLLIIMNLLWQRGSEHKNRFSWKSLKQRFTPIIATTILACFTAFVATGSYIFYNTNILNKKRSALDVEADLADYERSYKQYEDQLFPDLVNMYAEVDIYPEDKEAFVYGRYTLQNNFNEPISELHFTIPPNITLTSLEVPDSEVTHSDTQLGYYIYVLNQPMQSGDLFDVNFQVEWLTPGFVNNNPNTRLLSNGTFFNNIEAFPLPGYSKESELIDNNRRRRYDLPPAERVAKIDDESKHDEGFGTIRMRAGYEAIVSTSHDQIAVTPGYLEREWEQNGRRYFHYKMDEPIWPFVSFLSADYEMKADSWNDIDIEVYYKHGYNVDRMIDASKKSLDYFTKNFSPYQYRQYRIFEFPRQRGSFAQSFPNTIPFSENIGFVADIRDPADIDPVFYVTAHELAHQWWGHQVSGANVQGGAMILETLSQYSALMVMEQEYGQAHMQRFLNYELDSYLSGRGAEVLEELPLMLVENQGYIHYRKGSLVLYALKDYLGADTVNRILSEFIDEWGFQGPPYPTTRDLITKFRDNADPQFQSVITDLFEKIIIFDLRSEDNTFQRLPDGRFEVTINTTATKFEADGGGKEIQVDMDALVDVAVLGKEDEHTEIPEVLYIAKHQINSHNQSFTITVDGEPESAGIDPFNKLIDRNPDDNVSNVNLTED